MIRFKCPHCGKMLKIGDTAVGKTGNCPACGNRVQVPQTTAPPHEDMARVPGDAPAIERPGQGLKIGTPRNHTLLPVVASQLAEENRRRQEQEVAPSPSAPDELSPEFLFVLGVLGVVFVLVLVAIGALPPIVFGCLIGSGLCALVGGAIAGAKNAAASGAVLGFFLGPLGIIIACFLDQRPKCPQCKGRNDSTASVCQHCRAPLSSLANGKGERASDSLSAKDAKPPPIPPATLVADEIIKLKTLTDQGIISKEEFESQKRRLLNS
jgi:hypothetical protein